MMAAFSLSRINLRLKATRLVFSSCEVLLLIERARKKAEIAAFNSNFGSTDWDRTSDLGLMSPTL